MKVYTSYFGNLKKLGEDGIVPISISLFPPKWYRGQQFNTLAPKYFMLKEDLTNEQYTQCYHRYVLANLNASVLKTTFETMTGGRDCALLCFEKPGEFCHRHIVADWFKNMIGDEVKEYDSTPSESESSPKIVQLSLF